ncbi:hypothetical protein [Polaribacter porphyrae]|uniref:hypothetical protein n=1 Tax=Polaribacter porphyrae TaxID=1137780 RepID=UPI0011B0A5D2|nr:hypothetical protein [Polaribacter porphyrae]
MKRILTFFLFLLLFSCNKKQQNSVVLSEEKPEMSIIVNHNFSVKVKPIFEQEIATWKELKILDSFLERFTKASPNEALSNAIELENLIKNVKDSVKPKLFDTPSFKARVNILHNESLRLSDMINIPSIKAKEVNEQTGKIVKAYDALISKINSVLSKKAFEDAIVIDAVFIGLDSTKIDSISKKTIELNRKEKYDEKFVKKNVRSTLPKKSKLKNQ